MQPIRDDLVDLFDQVWQRFRDRMRGLSDAERQWEPLADSRVTLRWRLSHIAEMLTEERNGQWLGLAGPNADELRQDKPRQDKSREGESPDSEAGNVEAAAQTLRELDGAYQHWRGLLGQTTDDSLAEPIGPIAAPYGEATRRSFILHIADELIHHTAEAALLRDLYAGTHGSTAPDMAAKPGPIDSMTEKSTSANTSPRT
jgi:uncharacterized damage-inducible protein DinB